MNRFLLIAMRLPFYLILIVFSLFCLFAYIPFTHVNFIQTNLFTGLGALKMYFEILYIVGFLLFLPTVEGSLKDLTNRPGPLILVTLAVLGGFSLALFPDLDQLPGDARSLLLGAGPLLWFLGFGLRETVSGLTQLPESPPPEDQSLLLLGTCLMTGLTASLTFAAPKESFASVPHFLSLEFTHILLIHMVVFSALFVLLNFLNTLGPRLGRPLLIPFLGSAVIFGGILFVYLQFDLMPALLLYGPVATGASLLAAIALTLTWTGLALRISGAGVPSPASSGLDLFLQPLVVPTGSRNLLVFLTVSMLAWGGGRYIISYLVPLDWNSLLSNVLLLGTYLVGFTLFYGGFTRLFEGVTAPSWVVLIPVVLILVSFHSLLVLNPSLRFAPDQFTPAHHPSSQLLSGLFYRLDQEGSADFYRFLQTASNLSRGSTQVTRSFPATKLDPQQPPHVFLFVVDSLRPDYLAPYNSDVDFSPSIQQFAQRSVTYTSAYSRYSATGLSIPSLWVGGITPHLQYPAPFDPLNRLLHVLRAGNYRLHLVWDSILENILPGNLQYRSFGDPTTEREPFCDHLNQLSSSLSNRTSTDQPVFAYTLPQDLHIAVIREQGESVVGRRSNASYGSFYAPYASRVRRIDRCFGQFMNRLRDRGMLRDSMVILTSDHGEALGESGRWGHANTLAPESLKIPLIVHYPDGTETEAANPDELSFLTDVTPTLYDLLNVPLETGPPYMGRSLLHSRYKPGNQYLVASSYGAIFGMLTGDGNRLYVGDALNYRDYFYRTGPSVSGQSLGVTSQIRREYRPKIKRRINSLHKFYGVSPTNP